MKTFFKIGCILLFLCSCNTYKIASRHTHHKLHKSGLELKELHKAGYTITYWDSGGEKPVLILLHGFGASTEFQWYKQVGALKEKYRLILPNLVYFGGSVADPQISSIGDQVKAMQTLIDDLEIKTFSLCGISYGGLVSAELALANPGRVKKLVLCDTPVKYITEEDIENTCHRFFVTSINQLLIPDDYRKLKHLLRVAYYDPPRVPSSMLKSVHQNMYVKYATEQNGLLNSLTKERPLYTAKNYPFQFPVLLIWGAEDQLIPVRVGEQLQKHIGENAKLVLIPKTAHMPNVEAPEAFNKVLVEFLKD